MRISIVVNPVSGTNSARKRAKRVVKALEEHFCIKALYTEYAGHGIELTQQLIAKGTDILIAVGGDGTVNEISSALTGSRTALFIVPTGSGNGLARDLGMYGLSIKQIIERIEQNNVHLIDSGMADEKAFFCTCGTGFDAYIGHLFAQTKVRGFLTYIKLSLHAFKNYTPLTYQLKTDQGEYTRQAFVINIANNKQFGNNAYIAPMANMQDGLFTVTIIKPFKWYNVPYMAYSLFFKRMHKNKFVETFDCGDCKLTIPENGYLHVDGEPITTQSNPVLIQIKPASIHVL
ncbi:MAG: diacylglycerol kinase family lipid kinase [Paludibacteraceae bacterium]|nr:diacylglycerol kinase family lipid kinase [Paludibacteraceae bacterium]